MDFDTLVAPMGRKQFMQGMETGSCMLIRGDASRFSGLISLDDIEARINDGCNALTPVQVIGGGIRGALLDKKLAWTAAATRKSDLLELLRRKHSFIMMNMSQITPKVAALVDSIEAVFSDLSMHADMHLYVSTAANASGYDAHRDMPQNKLYLQVLGETQWQIFEPKIELAAETKSIAERDESDKLILKDEFELSPGDAFYMPPAVFHKVRNSYGPRVSLSIPFAPIKNADVPKMDRTYIPFKQLFESAMHQES